MGVSVLYSVIIDSFFSSSYGVGCNCLLEIRFYFGQTDCRCTRGAGERLIFCGVEAQMVVVALAVRDWKNRFAIELADC